MLFIIDKLILDVWTNGSIKPEEAIALASRILIEHLEILTDLSSVYEIHIFRISYIPI